MAVKKKAREGWWVEVSNTENTIVVFRDSSTFLDFVKNNDPITVSFLKLVPKHNLIVKKAFKDKTVGAVGLPWQLYAEELGFVL